jgi:hypothetical protein
MPSGKCLRYVTYTGRRCATESGLLADEAPFNSPGLASLAAAPTPETTIRRR